MVIVGCDGCNASAKLDTRARELKKQSLEPRLRRLASEDPSTAEQVKAALDGWNSGPERSVYDQVQPLIEKYKARHPEEADSIDRVMRNWKDRLDEFDAARAGAG
ncbi:hypothetical protein [Fontivita pretiosa]|uniref:hypothetical protein n=1 Tax=Fontivita pretiosa TaxID=2989684 RepID=UPI003D16A330